MLKHRVTVAHIEITIQQRKMTQQTQANLAISG